MVLPIYIPMGDITQAGTGQVRAEYWDKFSILHSNGYIFMWKCTTHCCEYICNHNIYAHILYIHWNKHECFHWIYQHICHGHFLRVLSRAKWGWNFEMKFLMNILSQYSENNAVANTKEHRAREKITIMSLRYLYPQSSLAHPSINCEQERETNTMGS